MRSIFVDQAGYLPKGRKRAVLTFPSEEFTLVNEKGKKVFGGRVSHFGKDDISGEDTYIADFSEFDPQGAEDTYRICADGAESASFRISDNVYDALMHDVCKCFYYLRCGDALSEEYAGEYYHKPCHMTEATVYGEGTKVDVCGGWHDAGDYGRYSTAGAVALAHLLYGVRFFDSLTKVSFDIPRVKSDTGELPDILAECKVELDFLLKMQREDGAVWHKVTTFMHAPFVMPEEDKDELFLFPVSSMATADIAAVFALAHTVYRDYDKAYAKVLLKAAGRAYDWLTLNQEPLLFKNAEGSNTGEYGEDEDFSNRFWAAASMYEATGDKKYREDIIKYRDELNKLGDKRIFTYLGWGPVAGLGSLSIILKNDGDDINKDINERFINEADRLAEVASTNGFNLCMRPDDFFWGSNMELLKFLMVATVAKGIKDDARYADVIGSGIDYLLGCNSMDTSYVTGHGEKAYRNPHLRPTVSDDVEDPWPGLVSGGPNRGLQDEKAARLPHDLPPMKCYLDAWECYSLNEITIYWNSPLVFVLAGLLIN